MAEVDPNGPVFICHRHSDGADLAVDLAWSLRSLGVPVWLDKDDLPPGDIYSRLRDALASGLSGAVLLITPDIGQSPIVKSLELPRLHTLKGQPEFTFLVASTLPGALPGEADHRQSDLLLDCVPPDLLSTIRHYLVGIGDPLLISAVAREMARQRMRLLSRGGAATLVVDVEGRMPAVTGPARPGLIVRYPPAPEGTWAPSPEAWTWLLPLINSLGEMAAHSGANEVMFRGGMHLSLAFAFGAALPKTARVRVMVEDRDGQAWIGKSSDVIPELAVVSDNQPGLHGRPIAVLVNLVPTAQPHDTFSGFIKEHESAFGGTIRIEGVAEKTLNCEDGAAIAYTIGQAIRRFAAERGARVVHMFLRTPAPLALLLGREFNTLDVCLYEWEREPPRYIPSIAVSPGGAVVARLLAQKDLDFLSPD